MYKSPIEILTTDIQTQIVKQQEEKIYQAVVHCIPNIDKEELLRALKYDRGQYAKGYADAIKEFAERLKEHTHDIVLYGQIVTVSRIDKLVEEVVGEGDAGVIVKPLEEYLRPIDAYEGLKCKYLVFKADTGERVVNCFVLRPDKDAAAVEALRTYAAMTDNKTLSDDIYNWVGKGVTVQQWIPVTERLPEVEDEYLVVVKYKYDHEKEYSVDTDVAMYSPYQGGYIDNCWNTYNDWNEGQQYLHVTHWMPLPEPPKEVSDNV